MTRVLDTPGQQAGERRLIDARGSIRAAFDALDLGFGYDEVEEYMQVGRAYVGDEKFGRVVGLAMGLALVCVEQDRALRAASTQGRGS